MARNGSGVYSVYTPGNPVVNATTIDPTAFNNTMNDLATALTNSAARNGEGVPTANWPMATYKLTGLGSGTVSGDSLAYGQSGAVLTNLSLSTQPAVNAQRMTTTQVLTIGSVNDLIFNTVNTDQASNYSNTTGVFTAPITGIYLFATYGGITAGATTATIAAAYFSKNNATAAGSSRYDIYPTAPPGGGTITVSGTTTLQVSGSVILKLTAADTVRVKLDSTSGGTTLVMAIGSWFSATQLS